MQLRSFLRRWVAGAIPRTFWRGSFYVDGAVGGASAATTWPPVAGDVDLGEAGVFIIPASTNAAIAIPLPTNAVVGQVFGIMLVNTSGGALGAITPNAAYRVGAAWSSPATAFNRTLWFLCISAALFREVGRTAADVPN